MTGVFHAIFRNLYELQHRFIIWIKKQIYFTNDEKYKN